VSSLIFDLLIDLISSWICLYSMRLFFWFVIQYSMVFGGIPE
jgi:hypothetical protein